MWFRLFKFYYEGPEVHLHLNSKHVLYSYVSIILYDLSHIWTQYLYLPMLFFKRKHMCLETLFPLVNNKIMYYVSKHVL